MTRSDYFGRNRGHDIVLSVTCRKPRLHIHGLLYCLNSKFYLSRNPKVSVLRGRSECVTFWKFSSSTRTVKSEVRGQKKIQL